MSFVCGWCKRNINLPSWNDSLHDCRKAPLCAGCNLNQQWCICKPASQPAPPAPERCESMPATVEAGETPLEKAHRLWSADNRHFNDRIASLERELAAAHAHATERTERLEQVEERCVRAERALADERQKREAVERERAQAMQSVDSMSAYLGEARERALIAERQRDEARERVRGLVEAVQAAKEYVESKYGAARPDSQQEAMADLLLAKLEAALRDAGEGE